MSVVILIFGIVVLPIGYSQKEPEKVTANIGENVILNCALDYPEKIPVAEHVIHWQKEGRDLPIYIWYEGYPPHTGPGYEGRAFLHGQASLNLTNVREDDQGLYECKVFFLNRPAKVPKNGSKIFLDVQAPPHFKVKPPDTVYVKVGEFLSLPCEAAGTPTPKIVWYKDNNPIESSSNVQVAVNELRINNIGLPDIGDYICVARNREGSVATTSKVIIAGPAVITSPPRNVTKLEGEKAEFICESKALPSNVTYKWYFNGVDINTLSWLDTRTMVRRDGTLLINPTSAEDSGQYTCKVYNGIGSADTASAWLNVEYPARITYSPTLQYLPLGLPGMVRCYVQANPAMQFIVWTKDARRIEPENTTGVISLNNGSFIIQRVTHENQGEYTCTPYNSYGTTGTSKPMEVLVKDPPSFTMKPEERYQQRVGGEVKMPCEGTGQPKPTISWRREDTGKLPKDRAFIRGGNLTLKSIKKEDFGRYECVLENEIATLVASSLLLVDSTTPHAPSNVSVTTRASTATVSWQPSYDGGFEQSYKIRYRKLEEGDNLHKTITVPMGSTTITLFSLDADTEYEFQVFSHNSIGDGEGSLPVRVRTKAANSSNLPQLPTDHFGPTYVPDVSRATETLESSQNSMGFSGNNIGVSQESFTKSPPDTGPMPGPPRNVTVDRVSGGHAIAWLSPENKSIPVASYLIEYKKLDDKNDGDWKQLGPIFRETSYLVKTFKPGERYAIKVWAKSMLGRGSVSNEYTYDVPGGNSRHSRDKAIAAGIVGGILFFIAAIVLSVCSVKICNERKRRKAAKAYLMVTCPIMSVTSDGHPHTGSPMPLKSYNESGVPSLEI